MGHLGLNDKIPNTWGSETVRPASRGTWILRVYMGIWLKLLFPKLKIFEGTRITSIM